ncbi:MAG: hypothetical protein ACIAXF_14655 [Phycisphaerales bacterium JB063]
MIKFRCKQCTHKIAVKDEHAGRKAKCPKCKEPIRVPSPKPPEDDFELEMVVPSGGGGVDDFDLEVVSEPGGVSSDLASLAAMEAGASAQMVSGERRMMPCPSCGAKVKAGAALCVSCGYNFKSGQKTDAAVSSVVDFKPSAKPPREQDPHYMPPMKMILCGLALIAVSVGIFYYLWDFENSNDPSRRVHALIAMLYNVGGKYTASLPFFLLGMLSAVKGMYDMRKSS